MLSGARQHHELSFLVLSGHGEVNNGCFLSDCAFGDGEDDFQSPVLPQCPCPAGAVPVVCLENCTFAYQAFSEYWMLVKITFTTGRYSFKKKKIPI